jgi:hypothetical protein
MCKTPLSFASGRKNARRFTAGVLWCIRSRCAQDALAWKRTEQDTALVLFPVDLHITAVSFHIPLYSGKADSVAFKIVVCVHG